MIRRFIAALVIPLCVTLGCEVPYKEDYEKAMELKAQAEQMQAEAEQKIAEAEQVAAQAQEALTAEQQAMKRIYTED